MTIEDTPRIVGGQEEYRGGDLLGDRSCKFRADTRLRQSVNVHQNKRARCPAESSECRKQVFIYMVHLADRREYRVGGF